MEYRLLPINAILSLLVRGNGNLALLTDIGFELAGLEIPVASAAGTVRIDLVLFRQDDRTIVAVETKSGRNIENGQAQRYGALQPDDVIRAAGISIRKQGTARYMLSTLYSMNTLSASKNSCSQYPWTSRP